MARYGCQTDMAAAEGAIAMIMRREHYTKETPSLWGAECYSTASLPVTAT